MANNRRLTKEERTRLKQRSVGRRSILVQADAECAEVGLFVEELVPHGDAEYPGTRFTLPDGTTHLVPTKAPPDTFFTIPAPFYESGAGLIWACEACGAQPLSESALSLYVGLASEQNLLRYGGVDPGVLSFRDGGITLGGILADWNPHHVTAALIELQDKNLVLRRPATISAVDRHLIKWGDHAGQLGELNVELVTIRTE